MLNFIELFTQLVFLYTYVYRYATPLPLPFNTFLIATPTLLAVNGNFVYKKAKNKYLFYICQSFMSMLLRVHRLFCK